MKIGILTSALYNLPLPAALERAHSVGIEMAEIVCGGTGGLFHCDARELLADDAKLKDFQAMIAASRMGISAFSCHCNPVHPDREVRERYQKDVRNAILLAEKMGVDTIVTFSGNPGGHDGAKYPNWATTVWPADFPVVHKYQWEEVLIPYWKETAAFARAHCVKGIALEMHPGFCVYNPRTLLRLRQSCGEEIGANFDPSHLIWQGIDIPSAIDHLKGAIHHFHVKDTYVDPFAMGKNGFFDPIHGLTERERSFSFRLPPGSGTSESYWRKILTALAETGYDGTLSIENEDVTRGQMETLVQTVDFLNRAMYRETDRDCWWRKSISEYQRTLLPK